jgi:hypothetical protein
MLDQPNRNKKIFKENLYPSSGMQCEIVSREFHSQDICLPVFSLNRKKNNCNFKTIFIGINLFISSGRQAFNQHIYVLTKETELV